MVKDVLDNWRTAAIDDKLRVTLGFLEKLTLTPDQVEAADMTPLRDAGVSDQAIEDAIQVCAVFNIIDRVADALGFAVPSAESFAHSAQMLLKRGYL